MGICIVAYNENDNKTFYLGSFSALFSQISSSTFENMPMFNKLIDESHSEDEFFIENEDLKRLIDEIHQLLKDNSAVYLSENLRGSLQDFLSFFSNKKIEFWKVLIA
jgi:hypothetical protein